MQLPWNESEEKGSIFYKMLGKIVYVSHMCE